MNENELTQQQIAQQDFVDNTIFSLIQTINPDDKEIEWDKKDMSMKFYIKGVIIFR
jgi:hypothetical protein